MKTSHLLAILVTLALATLAVTSVDINRKTFAEDALPASVKPTTAELGRARKAVNMLDNIYKQTIVLVTDKYVNDEDDFAAGSAAVLLFKNVSESGSHKVRLIDVTGEPYDTKNTAEDDFERAGVKRLQAGEKGHEEVITIDGKHHLRVLTPVPVVMEKCVMCHDHYADVKPGAPIGAISYTYPID